MSKKILLISAFPPNYKTAGQYFTSKLIDNLVDVSCNIDLICFDYPGHDIETSSEINVLYKEKPKIRNLVNGLPYHPIFTRRFDINLLKNIKEIANSYDILLFNFSQIFIYSLYIQHPYKVFICHDVITQKYMRSRLLELPWIYLSERKLLRSANRIFVFSEKDADLVKSISGKNAEVISFYLKDISFSYTEYFIIEKNTFCFYGAWNRKENLDSLKWFLKDVYPYLPKNYVFKIIGGGLDNKIIEELKKKFDNIIYLGYVADPLLEIAKCQALISPLFSGAGVKVKVIDAFSIGTPVIGTAIAFEGIKKYDGLCIEASSKEEYIKIILNWKGITPTEKMRFMEIFRNDYKNRYIHEVL